jgi:hypothetical protein
MLGLLPLWAPFLGFNAGVLGVVTRWASVVRTSADQRLRWGKLTVRPARRSR